MPPIPFFRHARAASAAGAALLLTSCGVGAGVHPAEGPFLAPGPLPRMEGAQSTPALPAGMVIATTAAPAAPAAAVSGGAPGLTAGQGTGLLPGAQVPGIGPVRVLVVPVSLGPQLPARDDATLARDYFGTQPGGGQTVLHQLTTISNGNFRPRFEILPTLVDSRPRVLPPAPSPADLVGFARAVLQTWAGRTDLTRFDDNGPDGIPASSDDDGRLDFVVLVVETDVAFPSMTIRQDLPVQTPRGAVTVGALHVLSLSRAEPNADTRPAVGLALGALGLDPDERFFPSTHPRTISSLARVRLGWVPVETITLPAVTRVEDERALLYPLQDLAAGAGFWLLERAGDALFVSRVARKADGHFSVTEAHVVRPGQGQVLPLTRQFGERGPRVVLRWSGRDAAPESEVVLSQARAADPGSPAAGP